MPGAEAEGTGWGGLLEPRSPSRPPAPPRTRPRTSGTACNVPRMSQPLKPTRTAAPEGHDTTGSRRASAQRHRVRRDLAAAAMELFGTQGYEETTVDEIAAKAGVARRTFFRHFRSKEEAIFPDHDDTLVRVSQVLESADPEEHPLDTVCRGIKEVLRMYAESPAVSVERYRLTRKVPTLREREIASVARYERLFTSYLLGHFDEAAHRDADDDDPLLAYVAASAVVAAHNHVLRRWLRAGGTGDVEAQLDHAFGVIRAAFGTGIGIRRQAPSGTDAAGGTPAATAARRGEVLVTVARTDAPLDEVMRTIEEALKSRA
ncbi:TetR family transcriptional regulator [Streptomyces sp. SCUT-3]|nr:TetR family transcriptional regulator [Streptomyces sp. DJ]QMV21262.1 TetR family transcriptional regulator [Streptomyces sp. SCUT-3]